MSRPPVRRSIGALLALAVVLLALLGGHASAQPQPDGDPLAEAAATNQMSSSQLREVLEDHTAHLDENDRLYYQEPKRTRVGNGFEVDHAPAASQAGTQAAASAQAASYDVSQAFSLHSRPGSQHTLYIDLDGQTVSGTAWNSVSRLPAAFYAGYSLDGDFATFNTAERTAIFEIWQRVSEDYAPFDIDVTTAAPADGAITRTTTADLTYGIRALVSNSDAVSYVCSSPCGGIAYVDTFDNVNNQTYQPAWIFPQNLAGSDTKAIAEAVAHEVGHTFGLNHDGVSGGNAYYSGQGAWAPIMGSSYDRPISQWSIGEYPNANNTQDDVAVIAAGGAPLIADEAGGTISAASTNLAGTKFITSRADQDFYALGECADGVTVVAGPAQGRPGTDLDIRLDLLNATGTVASADPVSAMVNRSTASGMSAAVSTGIGGTYWVRVDGVGNGTLATGYSDYASIGDYALTVSCGGGVVDPDPDPHRDPQPIADPQPLTKPVPSTAAASVVPATTVTVPGEPAIGRVRNSRRGGLLTASVRWSAPRSDGGAPVTGYRVVVVRLFDDAPARRIRTTKLGARADSYVVRLRAGRYRFLVAAFNGVGRGRDSASAKAVIGR